MRRRGIGFGAGMGGGCWVTVPVVVVVGGTEGDLDCEKRYQGNCADVIKNLTWRKCEVASFWDEDASLKDRTHAAGSSGLTVISAMSPCSWWDRVDWWALADSRGTFRLGS